MPRDKGDTRFLQFLGILRDRSQFTLLSVHERDAPTRRTDSLLPRHGILGQLLDGEGRVLASAPATVSRTFHDGSGSPVSSEFLRVELPLSGDAVQAILSVEKNIVWRAPVAAHPPRLSASVRTHGEEIEIHWEVEPQVAVDVIALSADGNARRTVAQRVRNNSLRVPVSRLPGGRVAFLLQAAAHMREAHVRTEAIDLPARSPAIEIVAAPTPMPHGQPITAKAVLVDGWGRVSESACDWSLDGSAVGHGTSITIAPDAGTHELAATLRQLNARAAIAIHVTPLSDDGRRWQELATRARGGDSSR